ncbi:hypothetical protein [Saccharothrix stipae]
MNALTGLDHKPTGVKPVASPGPILWCDPAGGTSFHQHDKALDRRTRWSRALVICPAMSGEVRPSTGVRAKYGPEFGFGRSASHGSRYTVVWMVAARADVVTAACRRNPERFVDKPLTPPIIATNVWILRQHDYAAAR